MCALRPRLSNLKSTTASGASIAALVAGALGLAALTMSSGSFAQNIRGSATGSTTAKGYDHPDQFIHLNPAKPADNMYPVIAHPEQEQQARGKLTDLERKTGKKPNLIVFLLDDVAWSDPGFNGGGIAVGNEAPTMDKLANEGLNLTSAYSTPTCSPSRATILTGQNPLHHGILRPPMYGEPGGLDGAITLPSILKKLGYVTRGAGKWHVGENRGSLPQNVGFDDYLGFLGVSDEYTEWRDQYFEPEIALSPSRFRMMEEAPFNHYEVHCTTANTERCDNVKLIDLDYIKDLDKHWMDYSVDFIKQMKDSKQPFFLYHATRGCHFDNYPSDEWAGKSRARTVYSDCLVHMDFVLAQLVKALEDTGQLENTLILLSSDNGPECEIPPHGRSLFRGCKGSSWEGGVRVPTFAYWKGMIKPRRSEGLFDQADILPTFVSLAGTPGAGLAEYFPKTTYIDGVDQSGLLLADNGESARRERIYTLNQYFAMIRIDEFKYIWTAEIENGFFQKGDWGGFSGPVVVDTGGGAMLNLYTDPKEDVPTGLRHLPMGVPLAGAAASYIKDLIKYPPQFKIGVLNNNPPVYDLLPKIKGAIERLQQEQQEIYPRQQ